MVDKKTQIAVTNRRIGEIGLGGRARSESDRLNGNTRASGISSFFFSFSFSFSLSLYYFRFPSFLFSSLLC